MLNLLQSIIYIGFSVWAIGCGLISTIDAHSGQVRSVAYMLLAGIGAGQVRI